MVPNWTLQQAHIETVTANYCTFRLESGHRRSEPTEWLTMSWDHNTNRLRVYVDPRFSVLQ